jgi:hypothetical protein
VVAPTPVPRREGEAVIETPQPSITELHKQWAKFEDERPLELALVTKRSCAQAVDLRLRASGK